MKGVVMGQAALDLPDPLESAKPADAQSADDLLSQLAGDEIDRMLAESDGEPAPPAKTAEGTQPVAVPPSAVAESVDLDAVLDTATAERSAPHTTNRASIVAKPADHSPKIELGESARRAPLILRPLEWLSSPLDPWPDQLREILGKIGLMTLINALAVLAYVLLFRRHHH
jgi:hypothetical protein